MNLRAYKLNFVFTACFGSHAFVVGQIPRCHFNPYYITSKMMLIA